MSKRQVFILIGFVIIIIAIPVTLYLVRQTQIFAPRAAFLPKVEFVNEVGNPITETTSSIVKLRITKESTQPSPSPTSSPSPAPSPSPVVEPSPTPLPPIGNLLTNGGFEDQLLGWSCGTIGADLSGGISFCQVDSTVKDTGNYSVKLHDGGSAIGYQIYSHSIRASRGDSFCLSAWMKRGGSGSIVFGIAQNAPNYPIVSRGSASSDGESVRFTATVPSHWNTANGIYVFGYTTIAPQDVWFDNFILTSGACSTTT